MAVAGISPLSIQFIIDVLCLSRVWDLNVVGTSMYMLSSRLSVLTLIIWPYCQASDKEA